MLVLIGMGSFSTEQIGAITWGQTSDIWAMTVAISKLEYGLGQHLGYREVELKLAKGLTTSGNSIAVNDNENRKIAEDPTRITHGIQAATTLDAKKFVKPISPAAGGYTVLAAEDLGFSDFYYWSFKIFGYDAYSTRKLFIAILACSVVLFFLAFWRSNIAVSIVTLVLTALFIETTSGIFGAMLPNLAANRFLSTLSLIPYCHVICAIATRQRLTWGSTAIFGLQALLLATTPSLRSSASWTLIALLIIVPLSMFLNMRYSRTHPVAIPAAAEELLNAGIRALAGLAERLHNLTARIARPNLDIVFIAVLIVMSVAVTSVHQRLNTSRIYYTDELIGHHLIWHNPYIALALHPDWTKLKPYPEQPDGLSDNTSWIVYEHAVQKLGISIGSPIFVMRYGLLDRIIRKEFLRFAIHHPAYMLKLYFYYKVELFVGTLRGLLATIPSLAWLAGLGSCLLGGLLLSQSASKVQRIMLFAFVTVTSVVALLPSFWAYSAPYVFADQLWASLFFCMYLLSAAICELIRVITLRQFDANIIGKT